MRTSHTHVCSVHTSTLLEQKASLNMGRTNRGYYLPRFESASILWDSRWWTEPKRHLIG